MKNKKIKAITKPGAYIFLTLISLAPYSSTCQTEESSFTSLGEAVKDPLQVIVLDLSGQQLDEFPTEILAMRNLEKLKLNNTFLPSFPDQISELTNLKALEFNHFERPHTEFTTLPSSIGMLSNLADIGLIGLPNLNWDEAMSYLAGLPLTNLAVMKNNFSTLPQGIEKLGSITSIWLGGNTDLDPAEVFEKLPGLEQVGFGGSMYRELPTNISNAPKIFNLWLANNRLTSVEVLKNSTNLKSLTLNSNNLTRLPTGIAELDSLTYLSLNNNPDLDFENIITSLTKMKSLSVLSLNGCAISRVPKNIEQLSFLKALSLKNNELSQEQREEMKALLKDCRVVF